MTADIPLNTIVALYGEALYLAQRMEIGMRIFYCLDRDLPKTPPGKPPRVDFDAEPLPDSTQNSLGGFLRQYRREMLGEGAVDIQTRAVMRKLEQSADYRNWLVHSSWWDWFPRLGSQAGREEVLVELNRVIEQFRQHDAMIRHLALLCLDHFGFKPEDISSSEFHEYLR